MATVEYTFEVGCATHDMVMSGVVDQKVSFVRVSVAASGSARRDDVEAGLVACQVAHETFPFAGMPTYCEMVEFPI